MYDIQLHGASISLDYRYDLVLTATGSRDEAERVVKEYMRAELRAGRTPG
jgi:hypothetical protein